MHGLTCVSKNAWNSKNSAMISSLTKAKEYSRVIFLVPLKNFKDRYSISKENAFKDSKDKK
jgi:hypothetical protein